MAPESPQDSTPDANRGATPDPRDAPLRVSEASTPLEVPVFNCLVYVSRVVDGGGVRARVANLAGLSCEAASEREALSKLVPAFKKRVAELTATETPIPWIDPPLAADAEEQSRFIPVHL